VTSLVIAAGLPASMLYIGVTGARDGAAPAHAALVLGFALDDAGGARPQLVARVDRAADLYRRGLVPRLILSGGASKAGHTEASVMRDLAMARGVPADAIVLDERARSTIENFACSLPILERLGAVNVLLVTEPWHMTRAMLLARRHGLSVRAAPATSPIWESPRYAAYWLFRDANAFVRELVRQPWAAPGQCAAAECEGCRRF
jgi:vancomycin permeability regulator SanA